LEDKGKLMILEAAAWCRKLAPVVFPDTIIDGKPMTVPMDLDIYVDNIITAWLTQKDLVKFRRKMEKEMRTAILFGIPEKAFRVMRYNMPIDTMIRYCKGIERLRTDIHKLVIPLLGEGEKILNMNIPLAVIKQLEIEDGMWVEQVSGK
jgi:hypothetical protein